MLTETGATALKKKNSPNSEDKDNVKKKRNSADVLANLSLTEKWQTQPGPKACFYKDR